MTPLAGITLVLALLAIVMLAVKGLQARGLVGAELGRKLVHMGMGTVCLAFPWIFDSPRPAWILALLASVLFTAVRLVPALRARFGGVLGGVGRDSLGEWYFPLAVALVFTLAGDDRAAFCAPVAILTFADAAGALVGQRWGRWRYPAVESTKSIEGSTAVFIVAWLCASLVLNGLGDEPVGRALLIGFIMALFAALVEAISWRGLDNLLLPIVALAQIKIYATLDAAELAGRAVVMLALAVAMLNWRQQLLDSSARLGAALAMYLFWSLGDWRWLVAPTVLLLSYTRLMPTVPTGLPRHRLAAIVCIASAGLGPAIAHAWFIRANWLWLFTLGLATQQAIIAAVRFAQGRSHWAPWQWWLIAVVQAVGVHGLAFVAVNGVRAVAPRDYLLGAAAVAVALAIFMVWDRELARPANLSARWWRQGITAALAWTAGFALMRV